MSIVSPLEYIAIGVGLTCKVVDESADVKNVKYKSLRIYSGATIVCDIVLYADGMLLVTNTTSRIAATGKLNALIVAAIKLGYYVKISD